MHIISETVHYRFDFLKYRFIWFGLSIGMLAIGLIFYFFKGGFSYHIDFTGGAEVHVSFENPLGTGLVREALISKNWNDAIIQNIGTTNRDFLIRIGDTGQDTEGRIKSDLNAAIQGNTAVINSIQLISAEVGKDITWNSFIAVILSLLILLIYIAFRFNFSFGAGAVIALLHDILAILTFILVTGEPFSVHVLASILAMLGYSINDTIVIFSQIRENFAKLKDTSSRDIVNLSINQTLTRTLLTSGATLLSVFAIFFFGGQALHGLTVVMLVGIIVGTYSSIYIASPAMLAIQAKKASN
jgi:preprotein translocase subunit SecF